MASTSSPKQMQMLNEDQPRPRTCQEKNFPASYLEVTVTQDPSYSVSYLTFCKLVHQTCHGLSSFPFLSSTSLSYLHLQCKTQFSRSYLVADDQAAQQIYGFTVKWCSLELFQIYLTSIEAGSLDQIVKPKKLIQNFRGESDINITKVLYIRKLKFYHSLFK